PPSEGGSNGDSRREIRWNASARRVVGYAASAGARSLDLRRHGGVVYPDCPSRVHSRLGHEDRPSPSRSETAVPARFAPACPGYGILPAAAVHADVADGHGPARPAYEAG